jgi:hypothetical protein
MTENSIIDQIESEIDSLADMTDDGDGPVDDAGRPYDPTAEFEEPEPVSLDRPAPIERGLSPDEWEMFGEGPPKYWDKFADALNAGNLDGIPVRIRPGQLDWGDPMLAFARSKQKPRGKTLVAHVDMTPESMAYLQGNIGGRQYDKDPEAFMSQRRTDDVAEYADRFREGDRPGPFVVEMDTDGDPSGHQEGRHRALAARKAGLDWVPVVMLWDTAGTFRRWNEENYRDHYPEK